MLNLEAIKIFLKLLDLWSNGMVIIIRSYLFLLFKPIGRDNFLSLALKAMNGMMMKGLDLLKILFMIISSLEVLSNLVKAKVWIRNGVWMNITRIIKINVYIILFWLLSKLMIILLADLGPISMNGSIKRFIIWYMHICHLVRLH